MDIRYFVENLDIPSGESRRLNCPVCKSYKTFTATNNMGSLLWNCYKASCSVGGSVRVKLSVDDIRRMKSVRAEPDPFVLPEYIVPHDDRRDVVEFADQWGFDEDHLMYDVKDHRAVFVCYDNHVPVGRYLPDPRILHWPAQHPLVVQLHRPPADCKFIRLGGGAAVGLQDVEALT